MAAFDKTVEPIVSLNEHIDLATFECTKENLCSILEDSYTVLVQEYGELMPVSSYGLLTDLDQRLRVHESIADFIEDTRVIPRDQGIQVGMQTVKREVRDVDGQDKVEESSTLHIINDDDYLRKTFELPMNQFHLDQLTKEYGDRAIAEKVFLNSLKISFAIHEYIHEFQGPGTRELAQGAYYELAVRYFTDKVCKQLGIPMFKDSYDMERANFATWIFDDPLDHHRAFIAKTFFFCGYDPSFVDIVETNDISITDYMRTVKDIEEQCAESSEALFPSRIGLYDVDQEALRR